MVEDETLRETKPSSSSSSWKKLPMRDSPYARAKHVQLVDKNPSKAIALFWAAINSRDRVDSALKDMAAVMGQVERAEEAIEAIKSFRSFCSFDAQEPLDNLLLDLYKKCGRIDDQISLLEFKLKTIDEGLTSGGRSTKLARCQGKKCQVSINQKKYRLLGSLAWAYLRSEKYKEAEAFYWQALAIDPDYNKQCNLAICLMQTGKLPEAKSLLRLVPSPSRNLNAESYYLKSFDHACILLKELESRSTPSGKKEDIKIQVQSDPPLAASPHIISNDFSSPLPSKYFTPRSNFKTGRCKGSYRTPQSMSGNISQSCINQRRTQANQLDEEEELKILSVSNKGNHDTPTKGGAKHQKMECPFCGKSEKPNLPILRDCVLSQGSESIDGIKNGYTDNTDNNIAKTCDKQSTGLVLKDKNISSLMSSFAAAVTENLKQNPFTMVEEEKEDCKAVEVDTKIHANQIVSKGRKSWADMVEGEEEELANLDLRSNSQHKQWKSEDCTGKLCQKINLVQGSEEGSARSLRRGSSSARRYLSFNERNGIWS